MSSLPPLPSVRFAQLSFPLITDVKKKKRNQNAGGTQNSVTRSHCQPRLAACNIQQDRKQRIRPPEMRPNRMRQNGPGLQRPYRRCTHMGERERQRQGSWRGAHSGRIHWESAESMFYRAIIRLVFGEGVKQTGPVRS